MDGFDKEFRKRDAPEPAPGSYSLHLYCRYENPDHAFEEFPHEFHDGQTYGESARIARAKGWVLHRDRTATCPKCAARLKAGATPS